MRDQEYRAREKKVHKMSKDGLVEENRATGEARRVSQRTADVSFDHDRPQEQTAGRRAAQRTQATGHKQKRPQPRPAQAEPMEGQDTAEPLPQDEPTMRGADDTPLQGRPPVRDDTRPAKRRQPRPQEGKPTQETPEGGEQTTSPEAPPDTGDLPLRGRPPVRGGTQPAKRRQQTRSQSGKSTQETPEGGEQPDTPEAVKDTGDLPLRSRPPVRGNTQPAKRRQQPRFQDGKPTQEPSADGEPSDAPAQDTPARGGGRLRFDAEEEPPSDAPDTRKAIRKRQTARLATHAAKPQEGTRLQFEDAPKDAGAPAADAIPNGDGADAFPSRQQKRYEKAERRVEQAGRRLEKAQEKLPAKRRAHLERQYDSETGKTRHRLRFEREVIPENAKPSAPRRVADTSLRTVGTAVVMKAHTKVREVERQNVAVEATHKGELLAEQGAGRFLRWNSQRLRTKPYRTVRRAERQLTRENVNLAWQAALRDNPELQKRHALAKWIQKQKIKRKYAQAAHEAKQTAQHTRNVLTATGKIIRAVAQYVAAHKTVLIVAALLVVMVLFFSAGITSCTAMLSSIQSSYISTGYMANEQEINGSDLHYTEMETDLQKDIDDTEINYPGYDEYRYDLDEIGHSPYELMAYLSAAYNAFTFDEVRGEIERIFGEQYTLTRETIVETRYDSDGDPYSWYVLQTTLTVRPMAEIIAESLTPGEQTDRYEIYMQTFGNRQAYGNPFDFPWLNYVSSHYGYRIHPISGEKSLHRGIDIAVPQGTPIRAVHTGRVISAGDAGSYGLCVVIEDELGYQSRYAHCSSLSVSAGQEVTRGDVIAAVGSTGQSTGPHLHLEVMLNGEYLNPYYFVDNGTETPLGG